VLFRDKGHLLDVKKLLAQLFSQNLEDLAGGHVEHLLLHSPKSKLGWAFS
jgi:hypothetical protein